MFFVFVCKNAVCFHNIIKNVFFFRKLWKLYLKNRTPKRVGRGGGHACFFLAQHFQTSDHSENFFGGLCMHNTWADFFFWWKNYFWSFCGALKLEKLHFWWYPKIGQISIFFQFFHKKTVFEHNSALLGSGKFFRDIIMLNTHRKKILWWKNDFWLFCGSLKLERLHFWWYPPKKFGGHHQKWSLSNFKDPQNSQKSFFHHKIFFLCVLSIIIYRKNFPDREVLNCAQKPFFCEKIEKNRYLSNFGVPSKMKFFQLQSPTKWPKMIFSSKKIPPRYYAYMNHQKQFSEWSDVWKCWAKKKDAWPPPPTDTFWSSVLYLQPLCLNSIFIKIYQQMKKLFLPPKTQKNCKKWQKKKSNFFILGLKSWLKCFCFSQIEKKKNVDFF